MIRMVVYVITGICFVTFIICHSKAVQTVIARTWAHNKDDGLSKNFSFPFLIQPLSRFQIAVLEEIVFFHKHSRIIRQSCQQVSPLDKAIPKA